MLYSRSSDPGASDTQAQILFQLRLMPTCSRQAAAAISLLPEL